MTLVTTGLSICQQYLVSQIRYTIYMDPNNYHFDLFRKCYSLNKFCKKHTYLVFCLFKTDGSEWAEGSWTPDTWWPWLQGNSRSPGHGLNRTACHDYCAYSWWTWIFVENSAYARRSIHFQDWVFHVHLFKANLK